MSLSRNRTGTPRGPKRYYHGWLENGLATDGLAEKTAKIASRNLLVAQLRYGQHSLQREAFWSAVSALRNEGCRL